MPGSLFVSPVPIVIEQAEPGGVSWTTRNCSLGAWSTSTVEADLVGVKGLGTVDVRDRNDDEFELEFHVVASWDVGRVTDRYPCNVGLPETHRSTDDDARAGAAPVSSGGGRRSRRRGPCG